MRTSSLSVFPGQGLATMYVYHRYVQARQAPTKMSPVANHIEDYYRLCTN